jgi:hypothetical protein
MSESYWMVMAFDKRNHTWDLAWRCRSFAEARKKAQELAIGNIVTFVEEGYSQS